MPPRTSPPTTIAVNGFAVREWRKLRGYDMDDMAAALDIGRAYLNKIELGHSVNVSPKVFAAIATTLGVNDTRALMCNPETPASLALRDKAAVA